MRGHEGTRGEAERDFFHWVGQTLVLQIRLTPRASANSIAGISNGRLRVRVTAPPVDNAANQRMIELLAKEFGVAKSSVRVLAGAGKRDKRIAIENPRRAPGGGSENSTWRRIFAERASP
jgi:hypothetical protein